MKTKIALLAALITIALLALMLSGCCPNSEQAQLTAIRKASELAYRRCQMGWSLQDTTNEPVVISWQARGGK